MMNVKFKNWMTVEKRYLKTNTGSMYKDLYSPIVKDNGEIELVKKGKTCLYDEIQSYKESVDINRIIQRFKNGDTSALQARAAQFMDATNLPQTYAEMLQLSIDAERFFSELPTDIKKSFDNNFYKFLASVGSPDFVKAFGIEQKTSDAGNKPVESEVENNE